jgi:hypothetical protein
MILVTGASGNNGVELIKLLSPENELTISLPHLSRGFGE